MLHHRLIALLLCLLISPTVAQTTRPAAKRPATRPIPAIERIIIVSIDGGRPDLLLRAHCPTIRSLMADGSYTFWARTVPVALTLPSHVSMLTGVIPVRHGIHWNEDLPLSTPYYSKSPTLFELAGKHGYTSAIVTAKPKFDIIARPGTVDWAYFPGSVSENLAALPMEKQSTKNTTADNDTVVRHAAKILRDHRPDVLFLHFASTDVSGHGNGWGSPQQIQAIEQVDQSLGQILAAIDPATRARTAIIVTADHGGAGRTHGADDPRSRTIPWILSGPGIRKNYDLTAHMDLEINTYDTCATACYLLAIPPGRRLDGKPILEALEGRQLLR